MLLEDRKAVIYGAGGAVGGAVARTFAREGAHVFLTGRRLAPLQALAQEILAAGGQAETAQVDALDPLAVRQHADEVVRQAGSLDVSFNVIGVEGSQGTPLAGMSQDDFSVTIITAMRTQFLTMTAAARHMIRQGSGTILAISATPAGMPIPNSGGFGVACSAIEGLCRQLAGEVGPQGVRVICLRSAGSPDAPGVREAFRIHAENAGMTFDEFLVYASSGTLLKRLPLLADVANVAAFMASDGARAMTASIANLTCGLIPD